MTKLHVMFLEYKNDIYLELWMDSVIILRKLQCDLIYDEWMVGRGKFKIMIHKQENDFYEILVRKGKFFTGSLFQFTYETFSYQKIIIHGFKNKFYYLKERLI